MMPPWILIFTLLGILFARVALSLAFMKGVSKRQSFLVARPVSVDQQPNDGGFESSEAEPYFQMLNIPTATSGSKLDHIVHCAESGQCDVEEMLQMIEGEQRPLTQRQPHFFFFKKSLSDK
jgi:hypothetical protein